MKRHFDSRTTGGVKLVKITHCFESRAIAQGAFDQSMASGESCEGKEEERRDGGIEKRRFRRPYPVYSAFEFSRSRGWPALSFLQI
jgi:hypothetical protein